MPSSVAVQAVIVLRMKKCNFLMQQGYYSGIRVNNENFYAFINSGQKHHFCRLLAAVMSKIDSSGT
jgi:hypothetical protein